MPSVSQAQNAAMHAAAEGNSTLGIPKSVGQEFVNADHGTKVGSLPKKVSGGSHHAKAVHHAKKLVRALAQGDHKSALSHIGHALLATKNALHAGETGGETGGEPSAPQLGAGEQDSDTETPTEGISTPAPMQPASHYFGQVGPKPTPKAAPHTAPAGQLGATNHTSSGGFNKARFGSFRKA